MPPPPPGMAGTWAIASPTIQAGFEPAWSRYSVGFLLLAETVREAIAEGAVEYDLLVGDEAFKARFATGERLGSTVLLAPPISRIAPHGKRRAGGPLGVCEQCRSRRVSASAQLRQRIRSSRAIERQSSPRSTMVPSTSVRCDA